MDALNSVTFHHAAPSPPVPPVSLLQTEPSLPLPSFRSPRDFHPISWAGDVLTPEATRLVQHLADLLDLQDYTPQGKRRRPGPRGQRPDVSVLRSVVAELLLEAEQGRWLGCPVRAKAFTAIPGLGRRSFYRVFDALKAHGLIEVLRGFWDAGSEEGQVTKIRGTPAFFVLAHGLGVSWVDAGSHFGLDESNKQPVTAPVDLRPLRKPKLPEDRLLPLWKVKQSPEAREIRAQLKAYNTSVKRHLIESRGGIGQLRRHYPGFRRIFHGDTTFHGRAYDGLPSYQTMAKKLRPTMTIDGEPTVELDVHASHLSIVLGLAGAPLPEGDLYTFPGIPREAVKKFVVASLGNGEPLTMWPRDKGKDGDESECEESLQAILDRVDIKEVRDAVLQRYPALQDLSGLLGLVGDPPKLCGHRLTNIEADAIMGAILELMDEGILALPMHDGLIVQARHELRAREAMGRNYQRVARGVVPQIRDKSTTH